MVFTYIRESFAEFTQKKEVRLTLYGAGALLLAGSGIFMFILYKRTREANAQKALLVAYEEFEKALSSDKNSWPDVEQALSSMEKSDVFSHTSLQPYFQALLLEVKARTDQKISDVSAISAFEKIVQGMPKSSPLYYIYATKVALMQVDSSDKVMQQQGVGALETLAHDVQNPQRDMALYYLGYFAWLAHEKERASVYWQTLNAEFGSSSEWASLANAKATFGS